MLVGGIKSYHHSIITSRSMSTKVSDSSSKGTTMTTAQLKLKQILQDVVVGQIEVTNEKVDRLIATQAACTNEMQAIKEILKSSADQNDMTETAEQLVRTLDESIHLAQYLSDRIVAVNEVLTTLENNKK